MVMASPVVEQLERQSSSHQRRHSFLQDLIVALVGNSCRQIDLPMLDIVVGEQVPRQVWTRRVIEWIV